MQSGELLCFLPCPVGMGVVIPIEPLISTQKITRPSSAAADFTAFAAGFDTK